jgi:8-oxo-dGTP pyrophosphatase MutT (NUDIX family)
MLMQGFRCENDGHGMVTLDNIRAALTLPDFDPFEAQRKMVPIPRPLVRDPNREGKERYAAVMVLLYPYEGQLHFVLTRRRDDLPDHAGQISFPGGQRDEGEEFAETAIRETCEELGVCEPIELIGAMSRIYIPPSDFYVSPHVGYVAQRPEWQYSAAEVAEVIECPLGLLLDDAIKERATREFNGQEFEYGYYNVNGHQVWGATAIMLAEFEGRLRAAL